MTRENALAIRPRRWLSEAIIGALLLALPFLFFWRIVTPNLADRAVFPAGDLTGQYYPLHVFAARELMAGRLPLWNPYVYGGQPGLADIQAGVFYPLNLLFAPLVAAPAISWLALEIEIILHFSLASLFTYLFLRRLTGSRLAGVVAALAFTYGGYLTSFPVQQMTVLQAAVWLPLVLLLLEMGACAAEAPGSVRGAPSRLFSPRSRGKPPGKAGWMDSRGLGPVAGAGLAMGVSILAGHPQTSMYIFYTAVAYLGFRLWQSQGFRRAWPPFVVRVVVFSGVGLGLAAVQLLPTLEFIARSSRADMSYQAVSWGLPLWQMVSTLFPGYFGGSPQYVGILPLVLAAMGLLFNRRQRGRAFWGGWGALALLISFGGNTFLYSVLYLWVPGFGQVRNQERVLLVFSFAVAVLAGYGAALLVQPLAKEARRGFAAFIRLLGRIGWAALALTALWYYGWAEALQTHPDSNFFEGVLNHHIFHLLLFAGCLLLLALRLRRARRGWLVGLAVGLTIFNLFTINWRYNLRDAPAGGYFPTGGVVGFLQARAVERDQPFRIAGGEFLPGGSGTSPVFGLQDVGGNSPLHLSAVEAFAGRVGEWRRWQLLNVAYVVDERDLDSDGLRRVFEAGGRKVYELTDPLPRAWVAHDVRVVADREQAWAVLNGPDFDVTRTVVLARDPGLSPPGEATGSTARLTAYAPTRLAVDVNAAADGVLVLSEVDYPGWQARVDGRPAPILRADNLLRAVPVPAGSHRVEVVYAPLSFRLGLVVSIVSLVVGAVLVWRGRPWRESGRLKE